VKVGEPVTGSAGPAVGGATTGGAVVVVVGAAVVVVVGAAVVVVVGAAVVVVVVVVATGSHCAYNVSVPEFGNVYESFPA
jgi:hypothetical protein